MQTRCDFARLLGLGGDAARRFRAQRSASAAIRSAIRRRDPLRVYLPPGYDRRRFARYPVLYVLHGYTGDVAAMLSSRPWETNVVQWADRLIAVERMPPVVLGARRRLYALRRLAVCRLDPQRDYATYTVRDVVGHVDARLSHDCSRGRPGGLRQIVGRIRRDASRARSIRACSPRSPRIAATRTFGTLTSRRLRPCTGRWKQRFRHRRLRRALSKRKHKRAAAEYTTMEMLAYTAAYSPRERYGVRSRPAFRPEHRRAREDVFCALACLRPGRTRRRARAELARLRLRYLDCGRRDEYDLDIGARVVAERIREPGSRGAPRGIRRRPPQHRIPVRNFAAGACRRFGSRMTRFGIFFVLLLALASGARVLAQVRAASDPDTRPAHLYRCGDELYRARRRRSCETGGRPVSAARRRSATDCPVGSQSRQRRCPDHHALDGRLHRRPVPVGRAVRKPDPRRARRYAYSQQDADDAAQRHAGDVRRGRLWQRIRCEERSMRSSGPTVSAESCSRRPTRMGDGKRRRGAPSAQASNGRRYPTLSAVASSVCAKIVDQVVDVFDARPRAAGARR